MFADSINWQNRADGLRARVEMDAVFSPFSCRGALLEDGGARDWLTSFFILVENP